MLPPDPVFVIRSDDAINCLCFNQNRTRLYSGSEKGNISIWNVKVNTLVFGTLPNRMGSGRDHIPITLKSGCHKKDRTEIDILLALAESVSSPSFTFINFFREAKC